MLCRIETDFFRFTFGRPWNNTWAYLCTDFYVRACKTNVCMCVVCARGHALFLWYHTVLWFKVRQKEKNENENKTQQSEGEKTLLTQICKCWIKHISRNGKRFILMAIWVTVAVLFYICFCFIFLFGLVVNKIFSYSLLSPLLFISHTQQAHGTQFRWHCTWILFGVFK